MKHFLFATALMLCASLLALGQTTERPSRKASIDELRGVENVFVGPALRTSLQQKIIDTVRKKLPRLRVVSNLGEAEIWLRVTVERKLEWNRVPANPNEAGSTERQSAELLFVIDAQILRIKPNQPFGLIKEFRAQGGDPQKLAQIFADEFIDTYKLANAAAANPISATGTEAILSCAPAQAVTNNAPEAASEVEVLRVNTNLVSINVSVLDRENRHIPTLTRDAFSLHDGGVKQVLSYFATVNEPFTVALLIDTSRSVKSKLRDIMAAANAFVSHLRPDDRLMVVTFDADINEVVKMGRIADVTKQNFTIDPGMGANTFLYDAVAFAINKRLNEVPGRKAIVLLTDGVGDERNAGVKSNIRDAEESGVLVYPIQFDSYAEATKQFTGRDAGRMLAAYALLYDRGTNYLKELARKSGGRFYAANESQNFSDAFAAIVKELSNQYSLGYYPRPLPKIGERRNVKVTVDLPNVAVRSRNKYVFAPRY